MRIIFVCHTGNRHHVGHELPPLILANEEIQGIELTLPTLVVTIDYRGHDVRLHGQQCVLGIIFHIAYVSPDNLRYIFHIRLDITESSHITSVL